MEDLIRQAFLHVDIIGPHVAEGHYDLVGPNGENILPSLWEDIVEPDWVVTMQMWPIADNAESEDSILQVADTQTPPPPILPPKKKKKAKDVSKPGRLKPKVKLPAVSSTLPTNQPTLSGSHTDPDTASSTNLASTSDKSPAPTVDVDPSLEETTLDLGEETESKTSADEEDNDSITDDTSPQSWSPLATEARYSEKNIILREVPGCTYHQRCRSSKTASVEDVEDSSDDT